MGLGMNITKRTKTITTYSKKDIYYYRPKEIWPKLAGNSDKYSFQITSSMQHSSFHRKTELFSHNNDKPHKSYSVFSGLNNDDFLGIQKMLDKLMLDCLTLPVQIIGFIHPTFTVESPYLTEIINATLRINRIINTNPESTNSPLELYSIITKIHSTTSKMPKNNIEEFFQTGTRLLFIQKQQPSHVSNFVQHISPPNTPFPGIFPFCPKNI